MHSSFPFWVISRVSCNVPVSCVFIKFSNLNNQSHQLKYPFFQIEPPTKDLFNSIFNESSSSSDSKDSSTDSPSPPKVLQTNDTSVTSSTASKPKRNRSRFEPIENVEIKVEPTEETSHTYQDTLKPIIFKRKENAVGDSNKVKNKQKRKVNKSSLSFVDDIDISSESDSEDKQSQNGVRNKIKATLHRPSTISIRKVQEPYFDRDKDETNLENKSDAENSTNRSHERRPNVHSSQTIQSSSKYIDSSPAMEPNDSNKKDSIGEDRSKRKVGTDTHTAKASSGIFSGLDFNELNKYRDLMGGSGSSKANAERSSSDSDSESDGEDSFMPALPPNFVSPLQTVRQKSDKSKLVGTCGAHDGNEWREDKKKSAKKKKKSKDSKKSHKKEKKKSHKKEKRKKRSRDYSSSSSQSD